MRRYIEVIIYDKNKPDKIKFKTSTVPLKYSTLFKGLIADTTHPDFHNLGNINIVGTLNVEAGGGLAHLELSILNLSKEMKVGVGDYVRVFACYPNGYPEIYPVSEMFYGVVQNFQDPLEGKNRKYTMYAQSRSKTRYPSLDDLRLSKNLTSKQDNKTPSRTFKSILSTIFSLYKEKMTNYTKNNKTSVLHGFKLVRENFIVSKSIENIPVPNFNIDNLTFNEAIEHLVYVVNKNSNTGDSNKGKRKRIRIKYDLERITFTEVIGDINKKPILITANNALLKQPTISNIGVVLQFTLFLNNDLRMFDVVQFDDTVDYEVEVANAVWISHLQGYSQDFEFSKKKFEVMGLSMQFNSVEATPMTMEVTCYRIALKSKE